MGQEVGWARGCVIWETLANEEAVGGPERKEWFCCTSWTGLVEIWMLLGIGRLGSKGERGCTSVKCISAFQY